MEEKFGINISGYINKDFGLGVAVRANINAVKTANIPFVVNDVNFSLLKEIKSGNHHIANLTEENPYNVNLIQVNFDNLNNFFSDKNKSYFEGKYNIGFWAWELDSLPEEAKPFFKILDEIWVPSNFCAEAISKDSTLPTLKVMHSIAMEESEFRRSEFDLSEEKFVFLTMFDYHSNIERKNPFATIEAYEKAFGKNDTKTLLVIKTSISTKFPTEKSKLLSRIADNKSIILIEEILETKKLQGLINICDCFVSLHRSEGFGLTMAEAMFFGKPVVATAFSANAEFMNINNSFLVKYNLISTGEIYYGSNDKNLWADPDIAHASELMKYIFENPKSSEIIAERGKADVRKELSPEKIGNQIKKRLHVIHKEILPFKSSSASQEVQLMQFENEILQKKIDKLRSLSSIKLKEGFKNFQNKITGKNRKYFWE
ncbi:glycosyltransferase [Epilithonimonas xixisoli]|uniref:Glycosyltransferase involved in cell wall biosynthesis n=1 Tax=Epilithonimonas xixisoli TaxID=1476462 RepID=A0A4R8ICG7_9FLAO|nr:glycosyltransferase [Epilithonimonas xixisoli]TDX82631.1 glycosyltransferase involved in cell wall biosynthesis [Epilithonimonas xixisoli]